MAERTLVEIHAEARAALKPGKPFRWLGPGILRIERADGVIKIIPPDGPQTNRACIVRDPGNFNAIGAKRIDELVKNGQAEYVNLVEGAMDLLRPAPAADPKGGELADAKQAEEIAQKAADENASRQAEALALKAAGDPKANTAEKIPSAMPADPTGQRTAALGAALAAPAGPAK